MTEWTGEYMCTDYYCPCADTINLDLWTETRLNEAGRTKEGRIGFEDIVVVSTGGFSTFRECYDDVLERESSGEAGFADT